MFKTCADEWSKHKSCTAEYRQTATYFFVNGTVNYSKRLPSAEGN